MKMDNRPLHHLHEISRRYPRAWKRAEELRGQRGASLPEWPPWCFLPLTGWYAIISDEAGVDRLPFHLMGDVSRLGAIGTWRCSQGIYRFDPDVYESLTGTVLSGDMPAEVFQRLPEWCVYVETPEMMWAGSRMHGFFAHLEWDANTGRTELRFLIDTEAMLLPFILHIGAWTVTEAFDRALGESRRQAERINLSTDIPMEGIENVAAAAQPLLALLLYLCSDEPEIGERNEPGPSLPRPKKTRRHGWKLFPPSKPKVWPVGVETGELLRNQPQQESSDGTHKSPRAHLRRAHWHGYWTGPRDGERRFGYKWLPPIVVAGGK